MLPKGSSGNNRKLRLLKCLAAGWMPLCLLTCLPAGPVRAQVPVDPRAADQTAVDNLVRRIRPLEKTNPEQAVTAYRTFLQAHPDLDPRPALDLVSIIVEFCCTQLRRTDIALKMCDWAMEKYAEDPMGKRKLVLTLGDKARVLVAENRASEAQALIERNWDQVTDGYGGLAIGHALRQYCAALEAQGKSADAGAVVRKALTSNPDCLQECLQGEPRGWMYERVVSDLIAGGHYDEALRWAKLQWVTAMPENCRPGTGRATLMLQRIWRSKDASGAVAREFEEALVDPARPNPLALVPLPDMDAGAMDARAKRPRMADPMADREGEVNALLALGRTSEAMVLARVWYADDSTPAHLEFVHRVLKAGLLNLKAIATLESFRRTGKGPNPLDEFCRKLPQTDGKDQPAGAFPEQNAATPAGTGAATPTAGAGQGQADAPQPDDAEDPPAGSEEPASGPALLGYVNDTGDGSLAGTGFAVSFERPRRARCVTQVRVFAMRTGDAETHDFFHLTLLDGKMRVLANLKLPYSIIARGEARWHDIEIPSVPVPRRFAVGLTCARCAPGAIYVGFQQGKGKTHSLLGQPEKGYQAVAEGLEWMVRAVVTDQPPAQSADAGGEQKPAPAGGGALPDGAAGKPTATAGVGAAARSGEERRPATVQPAAPPKAAPQYETLGCAMDAAEDGLSLIGRGHAVAFNRPDPAPYLVKVQICAARAGGAPGPQDLFRIHLLDARMHILIDLPGSYAAIGTGEPRWCDIPIPSLPVPQWFNLGLDFRANADRAVTLGLSRGTGKIPSFIGLPGKGYLPMDNSLEWMVRVVLSDRPDGKQE